MICVALPSFWRRGKQVQMKRNKGSYNRGQDMGKSSQPVRRCPPRVIYMTIPLILRWITHGNMSIYRGERGRNNARRVMISPTFYQLPVPLTMKRMSVLRMMRSVSIMRPDHTTILTCEHRAAKRLYPRLAHFRGEARKPLEHLSQANRNSDTMKQLTTQPMSIRPLVSHLRPMTM
jgi:hypothetical protein